MRARDTAALIAAAAAPAFAGDTPTSTLREITITGAVSNYNTPGAEANLGSRMPLDAIVLLRIVYDTQAVRTGGGNRNSFFGEAIVDIDA